MASWTDWKLSDILWGIFIPTLVAFIIVIFPTELAAILTDVDTSGSLNAIFVDGLGQAILTVAIPLFAGLIWNQWAGGGAGFLLGSIYALYVNDVYSVMAATTGYGMTGMGMVGDISTLGYVVGAMLVGYMAGALNKGSYSFRRMLVASLIAALVASGFELWTGLISPLGMVNDPLYSGGLILLPKVVYAVIIPIFVTLFGWFGISPKQMT
jgi:hypothetical protein